MNPGHSLSHHLRVPDEPCSDPCLGLDLAGLLPIILASKPNGPVLKNHVSEVSNYRHLSLFENLGPPTHLTLL